MAAPVAAGTAALVREYYTSGKYPGCALEPIGGGKDEGTMDEETAAKIAQGERPGNVGFVPSAALLRATMINGGVELQGTVTAGRVSSGDNTAQGRQVVTPVPSFLQVQYLGARSLLLAPPPSTVPLHVFNIYPHPCEAIVPSALPAHSPPHVQGYGRTQLDEVLVFGGEAESPAGGTETTRPSPAPPTHKHGKDYRLWLRDNVQIETGDFIMYCFEVHHYFFFFIVFSSFSDCSRSLSYL